MIYAENIFVCIAAPLVIALFLLRGDTRRFIVFFLLGLAACLLAAYINSFLAEIAAQGSYASLSTEQSMLQLTPICEEIMKALPVFFFVAMYEPKPRDVISAALAVGLGFATLENVYYISQYGAADLWFAVVRGFSAGTMHAICAAMLGFGLVFLLRRRNIAVPGGFALLCLIITFHSIYNLLVSGGEGWQMAGYLLPVIMAVLLLALARYKKWAMD